MNADGTGLRQVTTADGASFTFPDFSPSGQARVRGNRDGVGGERRLYTIDADGTGLTRLTSGAGNNDYPAYSPDGRRIVFISDRTGAEQVWVMDADGSHQSQLTHSGVTDDEVPDWSPDGRRIAYQEGDPPNGSIWVMNADGTGNRQAHLRPRQRLRPGVVAGRPAARVRPRPRRR